MTVTSYVLRLTSYVLRLTSYVLRLASYFLLLTSYLLFCRHGGLRCSCFCFTLISFALLALYCFALLSFAWLCLVLLWQPGEPPARHPAPACPAPPQLSHLALVRWHLLVQVFKTKQCNAKQSHMLINITSCRQLHILATQCFGFVEMMSSYKRHTQIGMQSYKRQMQTKR